MPVRRQRRRVCGDSLRVNCPTRPPSPAGAAVRYGERRRPAERSDWPMAVQPGERFGRYVVRGVLGRGGFATVYRAWDEALRREVALKALLPNLADDPAVVERFLGEARILAGFRHPNIVTVFDV